MSANLAGFNANDQAPMQSFDALPPADYLVMTESADQKATKAGDGSYLNCVDVVLDGQYKGRKVFRRLNLWNANQVAVDIANRELAAWCKAVGIVTPQSSDDLVNKPFVVVLGIKKNKEGMEEQVVRGYKPATAPGGFTAPVAAQPQQAAFGAPAAANAPAAAPAAAPAVAAAPPWAKK